MLKTIIFDLDGTLCDTIDDLRTAINGMLVKLGYKTRTRQEVVKSINNGARELVRRSLPKEVQKVEFIVDSALEVYAAEYAKCYCQKTKAFEGIKALTKIHCVILGRLIGAYINRHRSNCSISVQNAD